MKKIQRLYRYIYNVPGYGLYKIETYQRYDPLSPDHFLIKCFRRSFLIFWTLQTKDGYSDMVVASESLKKLLERFDKLGSKLSEMRE